MDWFDRQLGAPMNDWLIRLDAKTDIPVGTAPGLATFGDDFHDGVGSHAEISRHPERRSIDLTGSITESRLPRSSASQCASMASYRNLCRGTHCDNRRSHLQRGWNWAILGKRTHPFR